MRIIAFIEDYKIVKKILDWLSIDEFKRDRPSPKRLTVADLFDDYTHDEYIDWLYRFLKRDKFLLIKATGSCNYS